MTYIFLRTQKKCGIFIQLVIWQEKCHYAMFCDKNLDHLVLPKWCMMILFNIFYCLCVNVWVEVYYVKILVNTSNKVFFFLLKKKYGNVSSTIKPRTSWPNSKITWKIARRKKAKSSFDQEKNNPVDRDLINLHVNGFKWKFKLRLIEKLFWSFLGIKQSSI